MAVQPRAREAVPKTAIPGLQRPPWLNAVILILSYAVLISVALAMFVPFIYAISTSFKTLPEAVRPEIQFIPRVHDGGV